MVTQYDKALVGAIVALLLIYFKQWFDPSLEEIQAWEAVLWYAVPVILSAVVGVAVYLWPNKKKPE